MGIFLTMAMLFLAFSNFSFAQQQQTSPEPALEALQKPAVNDSYTAILLDLNRTKASQRQFSSGKEILKRRLLDKNNRTIGKIIDIEIARDGSLQTIHAVVDTGFTEEMSFNIKSFIINPTPDTYTIALDKKQIALNRASLLAQLETTADDGSAALTIKGLTDVDVRKPDGALVGRIADILVNDRNNQVKALVAAVEIGDNRGALIAIPYDPAAISASATGRPVINVSDDQARIIASFANPPLKRFFKIPI